MCAREFRNEAHCHGLGKKCFALPVDAGTVAMKPVDRYVSGCHGTPFVNLGRRVDALPANGEAPKPVSRIISPAE